MNARLPLWFACHSSCFCLPICGGELFTTVSSSNTFNILCLRYGFPPSLMLGNLDIFRDTVFFEFSALGGIADMQYHSWHFFGGVILFHHLLYRLFRLWHLRYHIFCNINFLINIMLTTNI